ncbi:Subtilisin inhibitor-like [Balamuthia mandrillaris]
MKPSETKRSWPEVKGLDFEEAKSLILQSDASLNVQQVPDGSAVTMDRRPNRVRVFVDDQGKVVRAPKRG